ncbi:EAL domain-containing protein [Thiomonas sp.]|uniref:putative bifunctional diguanylate cyclase/phosphodiesterase n=1 Tax=Thiomonas sp. TaxID=2047785 RepID=UPI002606E61A|nr:EAL domain-containing protein [Thiomonas sp.]
MSGFDGTLQAELPAALAQARILIVDDNPANVTVLRELLDEAGYRQVDAETSPLRAIGRWQQQPYDLLLLDMRMPELDGLEVMRRLQQDLADGDYLPCIVLTAQTDSATRDAALDAGALDVILKPFDFDETLKRIRNALQTRLLHRSAQQRVQAQQRDIAYLASHDAVTGLLNRRGLCAQLTAWAAGHHGAMTVLLLEITDADQLLLLAGAESVDVLLRTAAQRLHDAVQALGGLCAVWGGQVLLAVLPLPATAAEPHIGALLSQVLAPVSVGDASVTLHGRGGYAALHGDDAGLPLEPRLNQAVRAASLALAGGHRKSNRAGAFDQALAARVERRQRIEHALHAALQTAPEQFTLAYQPKVDIARRQLVGCEALLRWQHPQLGWVSPGEFIPIAEESGAVEPLGLLVLDQALGFAARLQRAGRAVPVAVNVSAVQFELMRARGSSLVEQTQLLLQQHGVAPALLELEITESALLTGVDWLLAKLQRLRDLGVSLALDDFGTGYSSLSYLQQLPIATLKIDRAFVDGAADRPRQAALLGNILRLAADLGLAAVAEGVEQAADLDLLQSLGCPVAQGYAYSRPLAADAFVAWAQTF